MSRLAPAFLVLGTLFVACRGSDPAGEPRPNVLLVSIDTLRADHLGCYGYERDTSPRIDQLAREGVVFERALSTSSWTLPAHLSLFTGLPVSAHGVCDDRLWTRTDTEGQPIPAPLRGRFASEDLAESGYRAAGFYSWKYLEPQFGFGAGFEEWERIGHSLFSHPVTGPEFERLRKLGDIDALKKLAADHPELPTEEGTPCADRVVDRALGWLDGVDGSEPFFLFVHLFDVHDPYLPPAPFDRRFDADYDGPIDGRKVTSGDSPVRGDMPRRDLEHLIALYDGGISWVDSQVGRLFDALDERGLGEDTLVIVTSDHGEEFFEHGHKTHRRQLYLESTGVPLVMRWPRRLPTTRRVGGTVGIVDVAPTILEAARLAPPAPLGGESLLELAAREDARGTRTYLAEMMLFGGTPVPERHLALARGDEFALLTTQGAAPWRLELFDLRAQPLGRGPGRMPAPDEADAKRWSDELERVRRYLTALRAAQQARAESLPPLDEHDRGQLAALGYAGLEEADFGEGDESRLCLDGCVWPLE